MPISLRGLNESVITLNNNPYDINSYHKKLNDYGSVVLENNKIPKWSDFYRNATDQNGDKIGEHELKKIKLNIEDKRKL